MQQRKRRPQKVSDTCPKCGYCDKCGRANPAPSVPYVAPCIPYVPPTGPYPWIWPATSGGTVNITPNPTVTIWNAPPLAPAFGPSVFNSSESPVSGSLSAGTHSTTFVGDAGAVHGN